LKSAVVLIGHGTVDDLDDLPAFLAAIRRGHVAPPALVAEVRRRYEAIGGRSPLTAISRELAGALEARLGLPVRLAMRLWRPYPSEALAELAALGVGHVVAVPLAQHSAAIYGKAVEDAAGEPGAGAIRVTACPNWGDEPALTKAFADEVRRALAETTEADRGSTLVLMTAHSLPLAVIRGGDPYEDEVRKSAAAVAEALGPGRPHVQVAFQSQGMGGGEWLGPDLPAALEAARVAGYQGVLVAPIGFLADHVEILYDLDVEAKALAETLGLRFGRTRSLNASPGLVDAVESVARRGLARGGPA
jgi:ferrochelatase